MVEMRPSLTLHGLPLPSWQFGSTIFLSILLRVVIWNLDIRSLDCLICLNGLTVLLFVPRTPWKEGFTLSGSIRWNKVKLNADVRHTDGINTTPVMWISVHTAKKQALLLTWDFVSWSSCSGVFFSINSNPVIVVCFHGNSANISC